MLIAGDADVSVIIPAWNAATTIARAINSALVQPHVREVIVIDDCSTDETADVAMGCDDGSARLRVLRQASNQGPSAARNRAISESSADFIAVLDADDFLLPGRFAPLLAITGWDMIADNMVFVPEAAVDSFDEGRIATFDAQPEPIDLAGFIDGNVSTPGRPRAELGFAKPVIRRAFLERHGLRYDEGLRLGEDYALYARILALRGVLIRVRRCGYVAVERANSLSGNHATGDLAALLAFDRMLAQSAELSPEARAALERHARQLAVKVGHRAFLDAKRSKGLRQATALALEDAATLPGIVAAILRDKLTPPRHATSGPNWEPRYLFA